MLDSAQKYWRAFWLFRVFQFKVQLEYRGDFIFWTMVSAMWTLFNFFFYRVVAGINNGIAGWDVQEITILISIYTLFEAFVWSVMFLNMEHYTQSVFNGTLNKYLSQPIDPQFRLMTQHNAHNGIFRFMLGLGILFYTLGQLQIQPSVFQWLLLLYLFVMGLAFIYFTWFLASTFTFWVEKLDNINHVVPAFSNIWKIPRQAYRPTWIAALFQLLPVGLVISLPSEVILQMDTVQFYHIVYLTLVTLGMFLLSRWFFWYSVKKYTGIAN